MYADTSSFGSRSLVLLAVTAATAALVLPVAAMLAGVAGLGAALLAMSICLASGVLVFWLIRNLHGPEAVVYQVLLGMMPRMGIALGACMAIYYRGGWLVDAGVVYYLLVFYFVTLAAETALLVNSTANQSPKAPAA